MFEDLDKFIAENSKEILVTAGRTDDKISELVFFASTFWRKMQNIFGECCISKLEKVARPRLAAILPAT
jgi:hypothetical protein